MFTVQLPKVRVGVAKDRVQLILPDGALSGTLYLQVAEDCQGDFVATFTTQHKDSKGSNGSLEAKTGCRCYTWDRAGLTIEPFTRVEVKTSMIVIDGDFITVRVSKNDRRPLISRAPVRRTPTPAASAQVGRDEFREAVRCVNAFKSRLGESLELRIAEDGTLRGAIMEEFQ